MITKQERSGLAFFSGAYILAWLIFGQGVALGEVGKLLAAFPVLFCVIWIIAAPEKRAE
jgi:hypothetical protein